MTKEFTELLGNLHESVKAVGIKKTADVLKKAKKDSTHADKINLIINTVLEHYGDKFPARDLFRRNIRGDVVSARNMIFVLITETTYLIPKEISPYMGGLPDYTIRNAICNHGKLDPLNRFDKKTIDQHDKLLLIITGPAKKATTNKTK